MPHSRFLAVFAVVAAVSVAPVGADSRIEYKATDGTGASLQTILIGHGKIRTEADKATSVIIDPAAEAMLILDHSKKTFTRFGKAEIEQLTKSLDDVMKKMEEAMAGVPPEMRERMKGMMGGAAAMGGPVATLSETPERGTVAGRPCRIYRTTLAGRTTNETCMGDASAIELPAADRATLQAAMAWSKGLSDKLKEGPMARFAQVSPFRAGQIPLRSTDFAANGTKSTSEFAGVTAGALAADLFAVPSGYKETKIEIPKMGR